MFLQRKIQPEERFEDFSATVDSLEAEFANRTIKRLLLETRDLLIKARSLGILQKLELRDNETESKLIAVMLPAHEEPMSAIIGEDMDVPRTITVEASPSEKPSLGLVMNQKEEGKFVRLIGGIFDDSKGSSPNLLCELRPKRADNAVSIISPPQRAAERDQIKIIEIFLNEFNQKLTRIIEKTLELKQLQIEAYLGVLRTLPYCF